MAFGLQVSKLQVDSSISEDPETKAIVDFYSGDTHRMMEERIGILDVQLDGRFSSVRTSETNLGEGQGQGQGKGRGQGQGQSQGRGKDQGQGQGQDR